MDDEVWRPSSTCAEERCEAHDDRYKTPKKHNIVARKLKIAGFKNQMASIRAQIEARRELASSDRDFHLPAMNSSPKTTSTIARSSSSVDRLKFPLLQRIERTKVANAPPKDPFLEVENVIHRMISRDNYVRDADIVTTKELAAASATNEAQQLGEEARKRMVAYIQNESGWRFEERTSRYQQVMEMKQQAEKAQQEADQQRETARQMKALLRDPYGELRSSPVPRNGLVPLASVPTIPLLQKKEHEWIWVLASLSTKLAFTPRNETLDTVIDNEKELSMYVIYYIVGSDVNTKRVDTEEQWQNVLNSDCPPTSGWMCYSTHGVPPAPELTSIRSGIQTWAVAGAGVGHLNSKYVASGVHDYVQRFKSSAGVELFRKCVPVASSLSRALRDDVTARPESARSTVTDEGLRGKEESTRTVKKTKSSVALPSGLAAVENEELDFRSMQRVGSWLSMNEAVERNRRMLASRSTSDESGQLPVSSGNLKLDGSSVMNQESREVADGGDLVESRPEVSTALCREWVLFARCSRHRADKPIAGASDPPKRGIGLGCLKRHYYISFEEKAEMTVWSQTKESWLEKNVLTVIIEREAQLERVNHLSRKCMVKFQQNLRAETEKCLMKLLAELNRVRFLTVKVLETIDRWRQHARKIGFSRYDTPLKQIKNSNVASTSENNSSDVIQPQTEAPLLGWSASMTLDTGKQLFKGSKAFVSKVKRFRRSEDIMGKREQHIVYLGYYETQEEAERAYDEHAASEARRLNTTAEHLPRRRNVFRSCGKHFAVESEKGGPSFCIECQTKQLASISSTSADEWIPPFFYGTGVNYIMKMANDLDFLDDVLPLKTVLNNGRGIDGEAFPMRGNIFLLPKTPIQDPDLAVFTTFPTPTAPRVGESKDSPDVNNIDAEALDRERIFDAQHIFLQELQIYQPELLTDALSTKNTTKKLSVTKANQETTSAQNRQVETLYWDHCAALKIQQERPPLAFRQPNIWCRPDAGEWASIVVRGEHRQHFVFEEKLEKAGKEMVQRRQQVLSALRQLNKVPLYFVPSRTNFTELIAAGQQVRGDVVQLEVNNATKRLHRYETWCKMSLVVQRWFRGVLGRQKACETRKALRFAYKLRVFYARQVATVAKVFYESEVHAVAVRQAYKAVCTPVYTRVVVMDGEPVLVTFHSLRHYQLYHRNFRDVPAIKKTLMPSSCCASCARRFHVKARYQLHENKFAVFRGICTCSFNGGSAHEGENNGESWLIRAYSSSHNVIYRLRLETSQLQQLISSQTHPQLCLELSRCQFRPLIFDMENKKLVAAATSRYTTFCFRNAENAAKHLANWRRMNSEATQTRKSLFVALEKSLSLLDNTKNSHVVSVRNAKKALDFESKPFSKAQAWDPLENANDWRFIVEKRQLTKRLEEVHQKVERLRVAHFQTAYNEQYTRAGTSRAQDTYNRIWLPSIERENRAMESAILLETSTRTRMENFMEQLCNRFLTLRDNYMVPTRRSLVIQSHLWHDLTPFRVDIPGHRRRLNHLRRRTLVLSNLAKHNPKTRRMIVTVSMWPLVERGNQGSSTRRDLWVTAYDPVDSSVHNIFLEWELVQLLTGPSGRKIWQDYTAAKRSAWRSIAEILLSLAMLDRFTGEFTLEKLQFYHTLRRLSPQYLSSRVMRDLLVGRKCGQGDEILRQAASVDGRLCVVAVYENWGDLTFAIYHTASGDFFRLAISLREVFDLLGSKPLMLRLWISCVKSNSYASTLLIHLLQHVKFYQRDDDIEDVRIEHQIPAIKRSKRYQTVIHIQKRRVLVSIVEDSADDFQVSGYDMSSEFTYKLLLERGGIHRILRTNPLPVHSAVDARASFATSSSSLLLRRNRKLLYEWICSRLRFQNMLEHPEMITSGTSPLLFGLHLRESFRILNRWVASSPRNPVRAVSEAEITRMASAIDTTAFSSLQFDQLALVAQQHFPFELEKKYVGTIDWLEAVARSSSHSQTWKKQLPYMRMDFFVKIHTVFARLRGELETEAKERKKRETRAAMEQEDYNALCIDITNSINSAKEYILRMWRQLSDVHTAATKKIDGWRHVHAELRRATSSTEVAHDYDQIMSAHLNTARMLREDNGSAFLDVVNLWLPASSTDLVNFISLAVPFNSSCPVVVVASLLQVCLERFEHELKSTLSNIELMFEKIRRNDNCLEELRTYKGWTLQFCKFLARQLTTSEVINEGEEDTSEVGGIAEVARQELENSPVTLEPASLCTVDTGILIPRSCKEPFQEVFLTNMPSWSPSSDSPFATHAQNMIKTLRPFFQQLMKQQHIPSSRFGRRANDVLTCQRVPYGVLVYQASPDAISRHQFAQLNPRAAALAGGIEICGPALFWPLQVDCDWYQRLRDCSAVYMNLSASSEGTEIDDVTYTRSTAVRSTKYLPWKQFAIERLRIARAVKRCRMSEGVCVDSLADDVEQSEKEKRTITTVAIGFRQLESLLGVGSSGEFCVSTSVTKCMKHLFALHRNSSSNNGSVEWQVSLSNPRILHNVLNIYDSEGRAIEIPCIGRENKDVFKMKGVQVEIDDVDKPRRLTFSCRELQTQRKYCIDCDYYNLQSLLLHRSQQKVSAEALDEVQWRYRARLMTVKEWRNVAALAAQFLVFRKKNGVLSLSFEGYTPGMQPREGGEAKPSSEEASLAMSVEVTKHCDGNDLGAKGVSEECGEQVDKTCRQVVRLLPPHLQLRCRSDILEEHKAVQRSTMHHFQKHQPALRAAASGRMLAGTALPSDIGSRSASEWMQMTREDWHSQELRGMLVLDESLLAKLESAYTPATNRARAYLKSSTKEDDSGGLELQMREIGKAMEQTTLQSNDIEILQSVRMVRWRRRGKDASAVAKRSESYLADVAEWWRRRLVTILPEKKG